MAVAMVMEFVSSVAMVVVGMLYPGYKSFKAIKAGDVGRQQKWLHYWLVLSVLSAVGLLLEPLLGPRVPMYSVLKIAFVGFLVHPKTAGYEKIYDALVEPQLSQHMAAIDKNLDKLDKASQEAINDFVPTVNKYGMQAREMVTRNLQKKPKAT